MNVQVNLRIIEYVLSFVRSFTYDISVNYNEPILSVVCLKTDP